MADKFRSMLDLFEIEANQVNQQNYEAIAAWCGGVAVVEHDAMVHSLTFPAVNVPCKNGMKRAQELSWVVKYPAGNFDVLHNALFHSMFEPVTATSP